MSVNDGSAGYLSGCSYSGNGTVRRPASERQASRSAEVLLSVVVILSLATGQPAHAQVAGMPMHFSPSAQPGVRLFGDYAFGGDPWETLLGARAQLNLAYITLNVIAGDRSNADAAWGGTLALNIFRGASRKFSLSLDGGFGETTLTAGEESFEQRDIPLGVGVALEPSVPGFDLEPWIGARLIMRHSESDGSSLDPANVTGFGLSAGVNVRTGVLARIGVPLPGIGAHVALDISSVPRPWDDRSETVFLVDLGLNYHIPIPGLPNFGIFGTCDPTSPC